MLKTESPGSVQQISMRELFPNLSFWNRLLQTAATSIRWPDGKAVIDTTVITAALLTVAIGFRRSLPPSQ